jgi:hypothetical protein
VAVEKDKWIATEWVAIRHLLGARDELSTWLCGTSIRDAGNFLLGDPCCDRIVFNPPPFEEVCHKDEPTGLRAKYLIEVAKVSSRLSTGDVLILVLAGHGDKNGVFMIGDEKADCELRKEELEVVLEGTKGDVLLINTSCYSGSWESPSWKLIAAAGAGQEAQSISVSGSGECRGGFFSNALIAEYAHEFMITAPCPASVDNNGNRALQHPHDFGPDKMVIPSRILPKLTLQNVSDWIRQLRNDMGGTYTAADITFIPCTQDVPHALPFLPLDAPTANLHRLPCAPPSPSADHASFSAVSAILQPQLRTDQQMKLSPLDEHELLTRAASLLRSKPIQTAKETSTILECWGVVHGPDHGRILDDATKCQLLVRLRNRALYEARALRLAKALGWNRAVEELGTPQGRQEPMFSLQTRAEASGCFVKSFIIQESPRRSWVNVAGWLARVWESSGCPVVEKVEWELALRESLRILSSL